MRPGHPDLRHRHRHVPGGQQGRWDPLRGVQRAVFGAAVPDAQRHQHAGAGRPCGGDRTGQDDRPDMASNRLRGRTASEPGGHDYRH